MPKLIGPIGDPPTSAALKLKGTILFTTYTLTKATAVLSRSVIRFFVLNGINRTPTIMTLNKTPAIKMRIMTKKLLISEGCHVVLKR